MNQQPAVRAHGIDVFYGRQQVLKNVTFDIERGSMNAIVGENGAGKSTLLKVLVSLVRPRRGSVSIVGRLGYCPQEALLFDRLTVDENLDYFATAYALNPDRRGSDARRRSALIEWMRLEPFMNTLSAELSAGTKQKVNLAISLLHDPDVLVLDEPYNAFDWATYLLFWEHADRMRHEGKTVVIVSHLVFEHSRFDRILTLAGGVLT